MIFYFSGTGNSEFIAAQIGKETGGQVVSINNIIKDGTITTYKSNKPFVIVAPTYAWRLPLVVEDFIQKASFEGSDKFYIIMTCGEDTQNAIGWAQKVLAKKSLQLLGFAEIIMPNNYLAMKYPTPDFDEAKTIIKDALPQIKEVCKLILDGKDFTIVPTPSLKSRVQSSIVNKLVYRFMINSKGFSVNDRCVSCNKCHGDCPLNNIDMADKRPIWGNNCTHCMACIAGCPKEAIEYKEVSKGKIRYKFSNSLVK